MRCGSWRRYGPTISSVVVLCKARVEEAMTLTRCVGSKEEEGEEVEFHVLIPF